MINDNTISDKSKIFAKLSHRQKTKRRIERQIVHRYVVEIEITEDFLLNSSETMDNHIKIT